MICILIGWSNWFHNNLWHQFDQPFFHHADIRDITMYIIIIKKYLIHTNYTYIKIHKFNFIWKVRLTVLNLKYIYIAMCLACQQYFNGMRKPMQKQSHLITRSWSTPAQFNRAITDHLSQLSVRLIGCEYLAQAVEICFC